jgi:hypothetical protein
MVKRTSSNPEIRATQAKLDAMREKLAEVSDRSGKRRSMPRTRKMSKPKLSPKRITELEREKEFVAGQGEDQIKQYEATESKNVAMDEEEDLEELTDGELEEVEKKKSWEIWLEKAFGGGEGTDVTQQKEGDTASDITQMNLTNAPKRVKGHFANTRDEKPAITGTIQHKTTQTGRSTSNYLKPENLKEIPQGIELQYLKNPEQEHRGAGSTRTVPKTQKELDAEFNSKEAEEFNTPEAIEARKKKRKTKAWEEWLEKKNKVPQKEHAESPNKDNNYQTHINKPIHWRALKDKSWENWLELRKDQGQGDARYGNPHETGFEDPRVLQTSKDDFSLEKEKEEKESNKPYIERKHEKDE